ncbi:carboxyl-terminal processing protease [Arachidicoccus rhizosphaerae]|uniref:Carboxyl-terminal processing protease n=1 Tax=Arachidicoccus rhizosphaerae TaxID=551991 RepID=A0A1H4C3I7_9BACT|nr:carboxy terminal-processing peptidase [Arachidicoccus rhizosphaerae]SEA54897.1 carboxyl-terminal processing protease [Arachidicoccus rhizosphaerae]
MMSKKALPVFALVLMGGILGALSCRGSNENDTLTRQQQLLVGLGMIIEQRHYSPKQIDDQFSQKIFDEFLSSLDGEKNIFLQTDIAKLAVYKDQIDDEIHGRAAMKFYPTAIEIFQQRIAALKPLYHDILSKPFDFEKNQTFQPISDSLDYPADEAADKQAWFDRLKYRTLVAYNDLLSQKAKAKPTDSLSKKSDATLEKEARETVKSYYDRYFDKRFNPATFNATQQFSLFVNTITHEMDPHSDYMPPLDQREFNEEMSNRFYGIGAQLLEKNGAISIESVIAGGAAWKSKKINVGDIILKVATGDAPLVDLSGYEVTEAVKLIRGAKGSTVKLQIKKASDGTIETISLVREEVKLDQAAAKSLIINQNDNKIGYLSLPQFYADFQDDKGARSAVDVAKELKKLKESGIKGLIIDLRTNPGGSLADVNKMIGYFVKSGPAVQVKNRSDQSQQLMDNNDSDGVLYDGPMIVMVNEFSASASEIFAAAMQDYHRAIIVGSTSTYGKGTVQTQLPLGKPNANGMPEFGGLKLTVEKFYRINGGSTQLKGVSSDIVLPDLLESVKAREKDNPTALPWDKINPATYTIWQPAYNQDSVIARAKLRITQNPVFNAITQTNTWMDANENRPVSLNLKQYKADQEKIRKMFDKDDKGVQLKDPLSISIMPVDTKQYLENQDKTKVDFYKKWKTDVSKDVYIKETTQIMDDMISQQKYFASTATGQATQ